MNYLVLWGSDKEYQVSSVAELDEFLDQVTKLGEPYVVGVYPPDYRNSDTSPWDDPPAGGLELGVGHPERSFLFWHGEGGGWGHEPDLPPLADHEADIEFRHFNEVMYCGGERGRVRPATARQAARQYVETGQRPTAVEWG
jgi:hypothetical protein